MLDRLSALHALMDDADHPPLDTDRARRAGQQLISRLRAGPAPAVADRLVNALWSSQRGGRVPAGWLSTPLGNLLQDAMSAAGRTATGGRPPRCPPGGLHPGLGDVDDAVAATGCDAVAPHPRAIRRCNPGGQ